MQEHAFMAETRPEKRLHCALPCKKLVEILSALLYQGFNCE